MIVQVAFDRELEFSRIHSVRRLLGYDSWIRPILILMPVDSAITAIALPRTRIVLNLYVMFPSIAFPDIIRSTQCMFDSPNKSDITFIGYVRRADMNSTVSDREVSASQIQMSPEASATPPLLPISAALL